MTQKKLDMQTIQKGLSKLDSPSWIAEETDLSVLSLDKQKSRLGVSPPPGEYSIEEMEYKFKTSKNIFPEEDIVINTLPSRYDLRDVNGKNFITPIRDQKNCGSCVAFGVLAAVESSLRIQLNNPNLGLDLSEAQLFFCYGYNKGVRCNTGWWPIYALEDLRTKGIVNETCYPYNTGLSLQNCRGLCSSPNQQVTSIRGYTDLTKKPAEIKQWITTKGPVSACFLVYEDFYYYRSGIYKYTSGRLLGAHCVAIVGYDDAQKCWICKNSWGTNWGENGFFRIGYGQCAIDSYTNHGINGINTAI